MEVTEAGAPPGTFYFQPKGMKICWHYLVCLLCLDRLGAIGLQFLGHNQPQQYYKSLLDHMEESASGGVSSLVDDRQMLCALREPLGDDTAANAEHEPELGDDSSLSSSSSSSSDGDAGPRSEAGGDLEDLDGIDATASRLATSHGTTSWGPFRFCSVQRSMIKGGVATIIHQIQMVCPFHHDAKDPVGTRCTRTPTVPPGSGAAVELSCHATQAVGTGWQTQRIQSPRHTEVRQP